MATKKSEVVETVEIQKVEALVEGDRFKGGQDEPWQKIVSIEISEESEGKEGNPPRKIVSCQTRIDGIPGLFRFESFEGVDIEVLKS
ncbi:MAG: hypothetical protein HC786_28440 [Richelia sp. CSU_2_1]|nr:hypothetical protein [Richelia sp. CSU_2_1]